MIRPITCICLLLAGGSGLYLYQSKHEAQMLDREIERTMRATDVARDRIVVLRGEWALLNEPERLDALSKSRLGLKSVAPSQYVTAAELGARLPPPGAADAPGEEEAAEALPLPPTIAAAATIAPGPAHAVAVKPPPRMPAQTAAASPLPRAVPFHPVLAPVVSVSSSPIVAAPAPKVRPAPSMAASALPAPTPPRTPAPGAPSIGESVVHMAHLQGVGLAAPTPQPAYNPPASAQPVQSALGGVRPLLPPPVPLGPSASIASAR